MNAHIVLLPGDGIGPEVISAAVQVLQAVAVKSECRFSFEERLIGGCAIDQEGAALSEETLAACKSSSAVLLGAVGGPKWDNERIEHASRIEHAGAKVRPEQGLLALRKGLGVYANLRPVRVHPSLVDASPLKPEKLAGVDLLVVRELTGGLYFGQPKGRQFIERSDASGYWRAVDTLEYTDIEIRRVVDLAFRMARARSRPGGKKVTSVDKANVLESSRLWRQVAVDVSAAYPDVKLEHMLVDTASMRLIATPAAFDVLVTENMFGDILTDEASVLAGSMGMLPSASLGEESNNTHNPGLYEPIHGSAPDIAGKGIANPIGAILSAAMLLRYSLKLEVEASWIEQAVDRAITDGCRTADLERTEHASLSTQAITDEIIRRI